MTDLHNKLKGIYYGLIVGDVYGAPYEFQTKEYMTYFEDEYKHGKYSKGGPFNLPLGYYTDDTSMMLCLAQSLIDCKESNSHDQIKKYIDWNKNGYMSATGECFDIGTQTQQALNFYTRNNEFFKPQPKSSGNGALMRQAPIPIVFYEENKDQQFRMRQASYYQTITTHGNGECILVNQYFNWIITSILNGCAIDHKNNEYHGTRKILEFFLQHLFTEDYKALGSGYVKDSLYIAIESVLDSDNFIDAIIKSIDYGYDTDTNACITGMLAGAVYGFDGIPENLITELKDLELLDSIFNKLIDLRNELNEKEITKEA